MHTAAQLRYMADRTPLLGIHRLTEAEHALVSGMLPASAIITQPYHGEAGELRDVLGLSWDHVKDVRDYLAGYASSGDIYERRMVAHFLNAALETPRS